MCAYWIKRYATGSDELERILDQFRSWKVEGKFISKTSPVGPLSAQRVVERLFDFNKEVTAEDRPALGWAGVIAAITAGDVTGDRIPREVQARELNYLREHPPQPVVVHCSLGLSGNSVLPTQTIDGARISTPRGTRTAKRFSQAYAYGIAQRTLRVPGPPGEFQSVLVQVKARTTADALAKGHDALLLSRAFINLYLNRGFRRRIRYDLPESFNFVLPGPILTVHHPDGSLFDHMFSFHPDHLGVTKLIWARPNDPMRRSYANGFRRLRRLPDEYRRELSDVIRRYVVALDHDDHAKSVLQLWSIIETLVGGRDRILYDEVIRRASMLFHEHLFVASLLTIAREVRNRYAHEGEEFAGADEICHVLNWIVTGLIDVHLANQYEAKSLKNAADFFQALDDMGRLKLKLNTTKMAISHSKKLYRVL